MSVKQLVIPNNTPKVFIIGLPRTGTTSVCAAFLSLGYKTAHTAYTRKCITQAQAIADTPVFCDYQRLDVMYPGSKFVYLNRGLDTWLPSIRQLLARMYQNLQRSDGGFNPHLKRCYNEVFHPLTSENIASDLFLTNCFNNHQRSVYQYFSARPNDILTIDVSVPSSLSSLIKFLGVEASAIIDTDTKPIQFEKMNIGGKVTAWNKIKHQLKVESTNNGRIDTILY